MHGTRYEPPLAEAMSRLAIASVATTLMSAVPASAEEPIVPRDMGSLHIGAVEASGRPDKQVVHLGDVPFRVDPSGDNEAEPYSLPQPENGVRPFPQSNVVGVMPNGSQVFCFCGGTSF
jgi:hypothetical protein